MGDKIGYKRMEGNQMIFRCTGKYNRSEDTVIAGGVYIEFDVEADTEKVALFEAQSSIDLDVPLKWEVMKLNETLESLGNK